jgi:hypothetical protein
MEQRRVGTIERIATDLVRRAPKVFLYAPVALVLGVLIVFSGHGELYLRSWGALLIGLWLALDLWAWLLKREYRWKFGIGWAGTSVILIGVMGIMWWWMDGKLEDQRSDVFQHLRFSYTSGIDPMDTIFTVTNESSFEISKKHELMCYTRTAIGGTGRGNIRVNNMTTLWRNGQMLLAPATEIAPPFSVGQHGTASSTIGTGGDAQSEPCLMFWHFLGTICADVTIGFWYTLENQPDVDQEKDIRYFVQRDKNDYHWIQESVGDKRTNYCN